MLTCAYVHGRPGWRASGEDLDTAPPLQLTTLFEEVSALLGRAARFGVTDMVLMNWMEAAQEVAVGTDIDTSAADGSAGRCMESVVPVHRFLCVVCTAHAYSPCIQPMLYSRCVHTVHTALGTSGRERELEIEKENHENQHVRDK